MMMGTMGRTGMGMPGMTLGTGMDPMSGTSPMMPGMMTMPRCNMMKFEKCSGGMKITCTCQDQMACSMMQNAEPGQYVNGRHGQLLHDDERHAGLLLQPDHGLVPV